MQFGVSICDWCTLPLYVGGWFEMAAPWGVPLALILALHLRRKPR